MGSAALRRHGAESPVLVRRSGRRALGGCFPAGHATTGFGLFGLVLYWYGRAAWSTRLAWLAAFACGLALGIGQQWRGAHFLSHTLWSAWLCWAACLVVAGLLLPRATAAGRTGATGRSG
ncbi:phosphatase PAP2 family protein [Chitinimonas koreensis]|uniref:phosphatase PAP2 family protein n=1 Tax=Chitinimonas koreensis TaxID=356302 RepID=UPI001654AF3A|nr:phosphatase PAP2 family protein [Chitinimonas koreensis]QNM95305.1 phosphatase PAP2 family protein [Chitinimonas koreensis]